MEASMPATATVAMGRRVAYHRRMHRMTQQQLADSAGIHVGTLRKIERGARNASDAVTEAIAEALGIDPCRLQPAGRAQCGNAYGATAMATATAESLTARPC